MKYIVAIIQPDRLEDTLALLEDRGIQLVTVSQVLGHGRQRGIAKVYRGHKEAGSLLRKIKIEIAVNDLYLEQAVQAIKCSARTGEIGDGKIFVMDLEQTIRIRTGETGNLAIG